MHRSPLKSSTFNWNRGIETESKHSAPFLDQKQKNSCSDVSRTVTATPFDDLSLEVLKSQLDLLHARCDAQSLEVFQLEHQIECFTLCDPEKIENDCDAKEESESIEKQIIGLEKYIEDIVSINENIMPLKPSEVSAASDFRKRSLQLQVTDLLEMQESQRTSVLELSSIVASHKNDLDCFLVLRKEQCKAIQALEDERESRVREAWGCELPTFVNSPPSDFTDKKIAMLRDQLAKTETDYLETKEMFADRVQCEREKLHEIKDHLQKLRRAYDDIIASSHESSLGDLSFQPTSPIKSVFSQFRARIGTVRPVPTHDSPDNKSPETPNASIDRCEPGDASSRFAMAADSFRTWVLPRSPRTVKPETVARTGENGLYVT